MTKDKLFNPDIVDRRTASAKRYEKILFQLIEDAGGLEGLSCKQEQLCRRAAGLSIHIGQMEAQMVAGKTTDFRDYNTACNSLLRILNAIGVPEDVLEEPEAPDLETYLAERAQAKKPKLRKRQI